MSARVYFSLTFGIHGEGPGARFSMAFISRTCEDSANEVVAHIPLAETSREAMPASGSKGKDSPSEEGTPDPGEHGTACHAGSAGQLGALHPPSPQGSLVLFPSYYVSQSLRMLRHWLSI